MGGLSQQQDTASQPDDSVSPQQQPANNLSTIMNGAGLVMNLLGAAKGAGPVGNSLLQFANQNDQQVGKQQKDAAKKQQDAKDEAQKSKEDQEGIGSLAPRIQNLDETYQPYAQTLAKQGDLKNLVPYVQHAESQMALADQRAETNGRAHDRLAESAQKAADIKLGKDAKGLDSSLAGAQAELKKSSIPEVDMMQKLQGVLASSPDAEALVSDKGSLKAAMDAAGIKLKMNGKDKEFDSVQSQLKSYIDSKKTPNSGIFGSNFGNKLPQGVPSDQLYSDFAAKHVPPQLLQQHQDSQDQRQAISFVRSELKDPDLKEAAIGHAQMLNQAVQMLKSPKPEIQQKGRAAIQMLKAKAENQ